MCPPLPRVEAICVLNQKKVFEDKSYARVMNNHKVCSVEVWS